MAPPAPGPAAVLASQWILILVAAALIAARLNLHLKVQRRTPLSGDILMCVAWASAVATASFDIKLAQMGALNAKVKTTLEGYNGSPEEVTLILRLFWASGIPFFTTCYLCKASLLTLYLQVFTKFMRKRRIFLWFSIACIILSYITTMLTVFCVCLPIGTFWSLDPKTTCPPLRVTLAFRVTWALHFSGDLLVFTLPWLIVPGLQLKKALKVGVYCTFLLGIIDIVFCLVHFITLEFSIVDNALPLSSAELYSSLDCNISLIIGCLPFLRPYFRGKRGSGYPYDSNGYTKSSTNRPSEGAFKVINEPYEARQPNNQHRPTHLTSHSNIFDDNPWGGGKKSTASDIELVQIRIQEP